MTLAERLRLIAEGTDDDTFSRLERLATEVEGKVVVDVEATPPDRLVAKWEVCPRRRFASGATKAEAIANLQALLDGDS